MPLFLPLLLVVAVFGSAAPAGADDATQTLSGTHSLEVHEANTPLGQVVMATNCIWFLEGMQAVEGHITATWDSRVALTERLEIAVVLPQNDTTIRTAGASPLTLDLTGVDAIADPNGYPAMLMLVQLPAWGIAYHQPVTFSYDLTYQAGAPVASGETLCATH